jgi:hypothetical protein
VKLGKQWFRNMKQRSKVDGIISNSIITDNKNGFMKYHCEACVKERNVNKSVRLHNHAHVAS